MDDGVRDLLKYPKVDIDAHEKACRCVNKLLSEHIACLQNSSTDAVTTSERELELLEKISKKRISLQYFCDLAKKNSAHDIANLLLLPKPPAVFDISSDEVLQIVCFMYAKSTSIPQFEYYKELLKSSLLLSALDEYLPSRHEVKWSDDYLTLIAHNIYQDGKKGAEILVY